MAQLDKANVKSEDAILSQSPASLEEIFAALDETGVPEDFLSPADRAQGLPQERPEL
jgi:hypothetical protein